MSDNSQGNVEVPEARIRDFLSPMIKAQIERSLSLTFARKEHGAFGAYCYLNGGTKLFDQFKSSPNYHPFHGERNLFDEQPKPQAA